MKKIICILAFSTFSFTAMATDQSSAICVDPLQRICTDTLGQRQARAAYVNNLNNLKSEIAQEAQTNAGPRIAEMRNKISRIHLFKRMIQTYKIQHQEIMNSAKRRIGDIESVITSAENIRKIKNYLQTAIDESQFDIMTKAKFKNVIETIIVGNFSDFIERTGLEDNVLAQYMGSACGNDGLIDNAFATTINKERYVLVCPGFLVTLSQTPDPAERFNSILHAISHEMGHHIDNAQVGNELYADYLNCLSENYAAKFKRNSKDEKFCNKKDTTKAQCDLQTTISHSGELVADAWGIKVTSLHMKAQSYSAAQSDQLLTDSWAKLCGSGDEGVHPSGEFRIGTLMRSNPDIIEYLGCTNSEIDIKPACVI
jgi:hypothetical protein